jgi:hypothetical protein
MVMAWEIENSESAPEAVFGRLVHYLGASVVRGAFRTAEEQIKAGRRGIAFSDTDDSGVDVATVAITSDRVAFAYDGEGPFSLPIQEAGALIDTLLANSNAVGNHPNKG